MLKPNPCIPYHMHISNYRDMTLILLSIQKAVLTYLLNLSPDEKVQLSTQTQHLQAHLLRTQMSRAQRSSHLQLHCQQVRQNTDPSTHHR